MAAPGGFTFGGGGGGGGTPAFGAAKPTFGGGGGGVGGTTPAPATTAPTPTFPSFPAATTASAPAPAVNPLGGLASTTAPAPAPAPAPFQFGGGGGGGGAPIPTLTTTTTQPAPLTGGVAFGAATSAPGAGASIPAAAIPLPTPQEVKPPPINLGDVYKDMDGYDNAEIRSLLDQLASPEVGDELINQVTQVLGADYFKSWMSRQLLYFTPPSQASREAFNKARTFRLLPSSQREVPLPGGDEEKEFVKCLSDLFKLEEHHALHILHQYQRHIYRVNSRVGQDTIWTKDEYRSRYRLREVFDYYLNERLMLIMNMKELIFIQNDPDYPHKRIVPMVVDCVKAAEEHIAKALADETRGTARPVASGASLLVNQAQRQIEALMEWIPPSVQDMDPRGWFKNLAADGHDWEVYRRDLAYHNLVEVDAVLDLLLLLVSSIDLSFRDWERMLVTWRKVRLGELSPVKHYLTSVGQNPVKAHKARTITAKMIMATLQAMQLNLLCNQRLMLSGGDGQNQSGPATAEHPFFEELTVERRPQDPYVLYQILGDLKQVPRPANAEYFAVVLLCWSCFMHLTKSQADRLPAVLRNEWGSGDRLYVEMVHQFAAFHNLADMVYDLLAPPPTVAVQPPTIGLADAQSSQSSAMSSSASLLMELWARFGYQDIIRAHARNTGQYHGPDNIQLIVKNTLLEVLEGILAAAYVGTVWSRKPMIPHERHTLARTRCLAVLAAVAVHENPHYSPLLLERLTAWHQNGRRMESLDFESPILYIFHDSFRRDPLLFYHLVSSLACGPRLAQKVVRSPVALARCVRSCLPQKANYEVKSGDGIQEQFFELTSTAYFNDLGVFLPKGVRGTNMARQGEYPLVQWKFSVGALVLTQLEAFVNIVHELRLRPILKELERTRRRLSSTPDEPSNIGLVSLFDRYPALFAYGPSPGDKDSSNFVDVLIKHGAWPTLRYSLRRVEMVIDQLALLVTKDETLIRYIDRVEMGQRGEPNDASGFKLTYRLPRTLVRLIRAVSEALEGSSPPPEEVETLVNLQVAALNLLRILMKRLPDALAGEYVGRVLFDEVDEVQRESKDTLSAGHIPFLVSLATQSAQYGRALGQHRIISQSVSLMRRVLIWACHKLEILSFPGRTELLIKMVEFALKVLVSMETWSFVTPADRWALARRCLHLLDDFLSPPFVDGVASISTLETFRYAVYDRFRTDNALTRALVRSVGSQTLPALGQMLDKRAKQEELLCGQGIFELRPVLPLTFDDMAEEERRAAAKALSLLTLVLKYFTPRLHILPLPPEPGKNSLISGSAIGGLALLTKTVEVPTSRLSSRMSRASPISFTVVLASLIKHPDPAIRSQAVDAFTLLISFTKRLSKAREIEAFYTPGQMLESTKGPLLDLLPLQEAHRLRAMLFNLLLEEWTRDSVLCGAVFNLLVEAIRQQPSLASVLVYVDLEVAKDTSPQAKNLSHLLASLVFQAGEGLVQQPWFYRFLWTMLKGAMARTKWLQTFLESIPQRDKFWATLLQPLLTGHVDLEEEPTIHEDQLMQVDGESVMEAEKAYRKEVESYCYRAASCRYLLDSLALLWHMAASANKTSVKKTVDDLTSLIQGTGQQLRSLRPTFTMICKYRTAKAYDMEEGLIAVLSSNSGSRSRARSLGSSDMKLALTMDETPSNDMGTIDLSRFRKAERMAQMKDCDPLKFRDHRNFIYTSSAVGRFLASQGPSLEDRIRADGLVGDVNEYYAKTAVQMGLLNAWKNLIQVDACAGGRALLQGNGLEKLMLILAEDQIEYEKSLQPLRDIITRIDQLPTTDFKIESVKLAAMVNISRTIRLCKLDLIVCLLSRRAKEPLPSTEPLWKMLVKGVEVNFERLWAERTNYVDQNLNLKIRLRLATAFLLLLKGVDTARLQHSGDAAEWWSIKSLVKAIWSSACGTLIMLDKLLVADGRPAMTCFLLTDLESVIQMCLSILDSVLRLLRIERRPTSRGSGGVEESKGPDPDQSGDDDLDDTDEYSGRWESFDKAFELELIEDMKSKNLIPCLMQYFAAASAVAAQEYPSLHNYVGGMTRPLAPRRGAQASGPERPSIELAHASLRMSSILKFFVSAAMMSIPLASELFDAHILSFLSQDSTVAQIADVLDREPGADREGDDSQQPLTRELMYMRGYQVDRKRSISYQLWNDVVRLVTVLVHTLTRPHLGYDVVLALEMPDPSKASLTYEKPLSGREGVVVDQAVAFLRRFQRLLSCPIRSERLTMALLDEAQVVMAFFREMAIHGYSWKTADGALHATIRRLVKLLVLRSSVALAGVCQEGPGYLLQKKLKDSFVAVSDLEKDQYKAWQESLKPATAGISDFESKVEGAMVAVLASAVAFTRYTGPLRLPPWIPLRPEEAAQIDITVGTRVKFRLPGESEALIGKICRRRWEYVYGNQHLMGTYEIETIDPDTKQRCVKIGIPPSNIVAMQDGEARERHRKRALGDIQFELPDPTTNQPTFNHGWLSSAHLLSLSVYCTKRLTDLPPGTFTALKRRSDLVTVLQHCLFLLIQCLPVFDKTVAEKDFHDFVERLVGILHDVRELPGLKGGPTTLRGRGPRFKDRRDLFYRLDPADSMMLSTKEEVDKKATEIAVMEGDLPTPEEINRLIDECGELGALESVWRVMDALRRRHYQAAYSVSFTTYVAALDALIKNGRWDKASRLLQDDDVPRCLGDLRGLLG